MHAGIVFFANPQDPSSRYSLLFSIQASQFIWTCDTTYWWFNSWGHGTFSPPNCYCSVQWTSNSSFQSSGWTEQHQDDDSKFMQELNLYDLFANRYEEDLCLYPSNALFPSATFIIWTLSRPIRVTEGNKVEVKPATPAVQHVWKHLRHLRIECKRSLPPSNILGRLLPREYGLVCVSISGAKLAVVAILSLLCKLSWIPSRSPWQWGINKL